MPTEKLSTNRFLDWNTFNFWSSGKEHTLGVILDIVFAAVVLVIGLATYLEVGMSKSRTRRSRSPSSLQAPLLVADEAVTVGVPSSSAQGKRPLGICFNIYRVNEIGCTCAYWLAGCL